MASSWMRAGSRAMVAVVLGIATAGCSQRAVEMDQGWNPQQVKAWYDAGQGSRLIPEAWFMALEQPGRRELFHDKSYMARFHFLPGKGPLPIGFVRDVHADADLSPATNFHWSSAQGDRAPWIGMTCASCHTSQLDYRGHTMRIEGGSTSLEFQSFMEAFDRALVQTRDDPAKFERFVERVLGKNPSAADREMLHSALDGYIAGELRTAALDHTSLRYGYGRNDAFGYIFNRTALVENPQATTGNEPTAPVSYPFLWNISQQTAVQWNGMASNSPPPPRPHGEWTDGGAMGRNLGEVVGVFGDTDVQTGPGGVKLVSSADVSQLAQIERQLAKLLPPRWPRELLPVDSGLAAEGKGLYAMRCAACHAELSRTDLETRTRADGTPLERLIPIATAGGKPVGIATDPLMACNAMTDSGPTGRLAPMVGAPQAPMAKALVTLVLGVLGSKMSQIHPPIQPGTAPPSAAPPPAIADRAGPIRLELPDTCARFAAAKGGAGLTYKARPLTGVWATPPYLHNGSVPTLYDLLLPVEQRPTSFPLGTREFDPKHVGFSTAPSPQNDFMFRVVGPDGRVVPGNSNQGHDFDNASLSEHQRLALVEYLKVIGDDGKPAKR